MLSVMDDELWRRNCVVGSDVVSFDTTVKFIVEHVDGLLSKDSVNNGRKQ